MSVASLLKQHFFEGGPFFMTIHYILWILIIIYSIQFLKNYYSEHKNVKKLNKFKSNILFIGGFGFLLSIFYQNLGFYGALSAIERAQDISQAVIFGGLRISLIAPLYSFFLFLISFLLWFVYRNMIKE